MLYLPTSLWASSQPSPSRDKEYSVRNFGTIPELYVRPNFRSKNIGQLLLQKVGKITDKKGWKTMEVTTPPMPEFERTLNCYKNNGSEITGGRKLKMDITNG